MGPARSAVVARRGRRPGVRLLALGERVGDVALDGVAPGGDDVVGAPQPHHARVLVPVHEAPRPALRGLDVQASLAHHLADGLAGHRDLCGGRRLRRRRPGHGRQLREREDREHLRPRLRDRAGRAYQGDVRRFFVTPHLHARLLLQPSDARSPLADDHAAVLGGALNVLLHVAAAARRAETRPGVARIAVPPGRAVRSRASARAVVVTPPAVVLKLHHLAAQLGDGDVDGGDAALHAHLPGVPGRLAGLGFVDQDVRACAFLQVLDALAALADDHLRHLRGDLHHVLHLAAGAFVVVAAAASAAVRRVRVPPVVVPVVVRGRSAVVRVPVTVVRARGGKRVRARDRPARRARRGARRRSGRIGDRRAVVRVSAVVPAVPLRGRIAVFAVPVAGASVVRREPPVPRVAAIGAARAVPVAGRVRVSARRAAVPSVVISTRGLAMMRGIPVVVMIARRAVPRARPGVVPAVVPASVAARVVSRVSARAVPIVAAHRGDPRAGQ